MATVAVFTMIPIWNDLWFPLILAPRRADQDGDARRADASSASSSPTGTPSWRRSSLAIMPVLILYVIFSRQLIRGITSGAVK